MTFLGPILENAEVFSVPYDELMNKLISAEPENIPNILQHELAPFKSNIPQLSIVLKEIMFNKEINQITKKRIINQILDLIPLDEMSRVSHLLVSDLPTSKLGKLVALISNEGYLTPLIIEFVKTQFNEEISDDDAIRKSKIFIDRLLSKVDLQLPTKQMGLTIFFEELRKINRLHSLIINEINTYDNLPTLMILWSLPLGSIAQYVDLFNMYTQADRLATQLTELFDFEQNNKQRAILINEFTHLLEEYELHKFLQALVWINSSVIPFLYSGLSDEQFNILVKIFTKPFRQEIFVKSIPLLEADMAWIIDNLKTEHWNNRLVTLCEEAEIDQPGQEMKMEDEILVPVYLTLGRLCKIFQSYVECPDHFTNDILDDVENMPPFLIAIGIHHPEYRKSIFPASKLLSTDQLKSLCLGFSRDEIGEALDELLIFLREDQIFTVLDSLEIDFGIYYINYKTAQLLNLYKEIDSSQKQIKLDLELNKDIPDIEFAITQQQGRIRSFLSSLNLQINKYVKSMTSIWKAKFNQLPFLPTIFENCQNYGEEIEGQEGLLQRLHKSKPEAEIIEVNLENILTERLLKRLGFNTTLDLRKFGITSNHDLEVLDIFPEGKKVAKMKKYLMQNDLESIWNFLISKSLCTLSTLKELLLIENSEEAMNLIVLATKLGYKSNNNPELLEEKINDLL